MELKALQDLKRRLEEGNDLEVSLHDSDRTVGYKLGKKSLLNQIDNIITEITEGDA
ncbi:hypothetical protein [Vibrio sp. SCSIO 43137]|uniref:hypothetical protein n=1 Tax=Vibrio sp. SCSIO 43137 TaxID=3021011 RepID=UPI002306EB92|nr:hypothetical protein [Vibrio sp. SCSIO 43137]WCE28424.1 hypothetical protein PK654_08540 [Vibrio sp. SCSIO 43137]